MMLQTASQAAESNGAVQLTIVVRDGHGRAVRDLAAADFTVTEDAAPVAVRSVRLVDVNTPDAAPLVSLVFDRMRGEPGRLAEEAAEKLLSSSAAGTVFSVWLIDENLALLQSFTPDRAAVKAAIRSAIAKTPSISTPQGPWATVATATLHTADRLVRESPFRLKVAALIAAAQEQRSETRRKAIVYFSAGLPVAGPSDEGLLNIVSAATQANVTLYTVDASGLAVAKAEESSRSLAISNLNSLSAQAVYQAKANDPRDSPVGQDRAIESPLKTVAEKTGGFSISRSTDSRWPVRRIVEDLSSYYELTYVRTAGPPDSRYHVTAVAVRRKGLAVAFPSGFYTAPETASGAALPYELPLSDALSHAPILELPVKIGVWRFRSPEPAHQLVAFYFEVAGDDVRFQEDDSTGLFAAHLSALALVRDNIGQIAGRFGADRPLAIPATMFPRERARPLVFQKLLELPPGEYILELAIRDQLGGRVHAEKIALRVDPPSPGLALSDLALVHHVTATSGSAFDGAFSLPGKSVFPSPDAVLHGGKEAAATVFFRVYTAGTEPLGLSFELWKDGQRRQRKALPSIATSEDRSAQVISVDVGNLAAGQYQVRVIAEQDGRSISRDLALTIDRDAGADSLISGEPESDEDGIVLRPALELPSLPPTVEQQHLLDQARIVALGYSQHLPNFICTQVTRRMLDPAGKDQWRSIEETTDLVTYYDRQEHYHRLAQRGGVTELASDAPSLNSAGEFGSLLHSIFAPESETQFSWSRSDTIRGRAVQVFSYRVDSAHSKNRISYSRGTVQSSIVGFRGLVFVDEQNGMILRITEETDTLPPGMPVRGLSLILDYGDIRVGDQVHLLPLSFTLDIGLRKRIHARNEVLFRSYQRFTVESRLVPEQ